MRFGTFFVALTLVLGLVNVYVYRWAVQAYQPRPWLRRTLATVLVASVVGVLGGRMADRIWTDAPVGGLLIAASIVELTVLVSFLPLVAADLLLLGRRVFQRLRRAAKEPAPEAGSPEPELPRRTFMAQAAASSAFLVSGSSSLYAATAGRNDYSIEELPVRIPGLSRALDGFTIVQLSDLHIGQFVRDAELKAAEELVARARPDLIVLTGDLLDHDPRLAHRLGAFVRRLGPLAREGVVAISGNHDYFAGINTVVSVLESAGADVLQNRGRVIGDRSAGFALLGVEDVWATRFGGNGPNLERALGSLAPSPAELAGARELPRILLCHNPSYFEEAASHVTLQLSGHTHGGQVNPIVRPANWVLRHGWVAGLYERSGSRLYVNRGFGTVGPPARLGASPEVSRIVLVS
jgi:uncharacterized protein